MDVQHSIATAIKKVAHTQNNKVNRPSKPVSPQKPAPSARFSASSGKIGHLAYTRGGQLLKLGNIQAVTLKLNHQATLFLQQQIPAEIATLLPQAATVKELDAILFSILQQSFKFYKDQLEEEKSRKRETDKQKEEANEEAEAEEKALELLDLLFEHAEDTDDIDAFCDWAKKSIEKTKMELQHHQDELPESLERSFDIMEDALLALENGLSPSFIKTRLQEEIDSKLF